MHKEHDSVKNRRTSILDAVKKQGRISVEKLAESFQVSKLTIRRDLSNLESYGYVVRHHGGVQLLDKTEGVAKNQVEICKLAIAKKAASLANANDIIFVNTSSTALLTLDYITAPGITVITNNCNAVRTNPKVPFVLALTGGELRQPKDAMVGDFAINNLMKATANKSFIGCGGINPSTGMTSGSLQEMIINELMINRTRGPVILLADHRKIGRIHNYVVADTSVFEYLITDHLADPATLNELKKKGVKILIAKP